MNVTYTLILILVTISCKLRDLIHHACKSTTRQGDRGRDEGVSGGGKMQVSNATEDRHITSPSLCGVERVSSLARKQHTSLAYVNLQGE